MKLKVLHIVGGPLTNGAAKGANILHKALLKKGINSKLLNDTFLKDELKDNYLYDQNVILIQQNIFDRILKRLFVYLEKFIKSIFLHSPRETFTLSVFGFDLTKQKEYAEADIIHIHWLSEGFINLKSLSKIKKPIIWTMRDEWPYTGGSHYKFDFDKYEKSFLSKILKKYKKNIYKSNFQFVAMSNWLKSRAVRSLVLSDHSILKIDNNIQLKDFKTIEKNVAKSSLGLSTNKQIILYGAQNPQSQRKGWKIFLESLKQIDKSKFFLLIFGKFWSHQQLNDIGIEYKSCGFVKEKIILNSIYSSADIFVASSLHDAWPKTFAEAMYCGTPAVCFDKTSISEIIDHKINGYVVKKNNPEELARGIVWLSKEIKKNDLIKSNAHEKIKNFDSNVIAKIYLSLYNEKIIK